MDKPTAPTVGSLLAHTESDFDEEVFDTLLEGGRFRLLRIVSNGQATPEGVWLDQDDDEWVVLIKGAAMLRIDGEAKAHALTPGDWMLLPAHCRHRVEWTAPDQPTVWLALHSDP
ncbi:cupin domain-containing protein [Magnetospirillum sp. 15-1]|uniref:cupin domain-containing protein n=1 Tax=Magnetospirillum sp. 15-1 TaxID=1979370 RepID=UPI000BBC22DD|nr:cupin domain-containing protein [Magnetospirillum sp. 15-1]